MHRVAHLPFPPKTYILLFEKVSVVNSADGAESDLLSVIYFFQFPHVINRKCKKSQIVLYS